MPRDRFSLIRASQGYQGPATRPGCHDCRHSAPIHGAAPRWATDALDCRLGTFFVHPWAICERYQAGADAKPATDGATTA